MTNTQGQDPVRDFLASAREAKLNIQVIRQRIQELESRCAKATASSGGVGGGHSDTQQLWSALADERSRELEAEQEELRTYQAVKDFIQRIPDPNHRAILSLRYLACLSWSQVQQRLAKQQICYTGRHITRLHGEALESAREIWRQEQEAGHAI